MTRLQILYQIFFTTDQISVNDINNKVNYINPLPILGNFKSSSDYLKFVLDQADYGKKLEEIKHMVLE